MKDHSFYLEYPTPRDKRKKTGNPTVLIRIGEPFYSGEMCYSCWSSVIEGNRVLSGSGNVSVGYLRSHCTRVSEAKAREIHPEIFNTYDNL